MTGVRKTQEVTRTVNQMRAIVTIPTKNPVGEDSASSLVPTNAPSRLTFTTTHTRGEVWSQVLATSRSTQLTELPA